MTSPPRREPPSVAAEALAEFRARKGDLWAYCTDMDVQTSLALIRALVRTLMDSPGEQHDRLVEALDREIQILERQADAMSLTVATTLKQYLPAA